MEIFIAEVLGTLILILLGNGVVANVVLSKTKGENSGWIVITAGWGFAVMVGAFTAAHVSGAHLNPAVTLGLFSIGLVESSNLLVYFLGQLIGAMLGQVLVYISYKRHYDETLDPAKILATFSTAPEIKCYFYNLMSEIIGTAMLLVGILGITNPNNAIGDFGPLLVGLLVFSIGLSLGGPTGYAINPVRDLGPRIVHSILNIKNKGDSNWSYAMVPVLGPIIGGILGALIYNCIFI